MSGSFTDFGEKIYNKLFMELINGANPKPLVAVVKRLQELGDVPVVETLEQAEEPFGKGSLISDALRSKLPSKTPLDVRKQIEDDFASDCYNRRCAAREYITKGSYVHASDLKPLYSVVVVEAECQSLEDKASYCGFKTTEDYSRALGK